MAHFSRRHFLAGMGITGLIAGNSAWLLAGTDSAAERLNKLLDASLADLPAATISAALIKNGDIVWGNTAGYQRLDTEQRATQDSIWPNLASVTKLVTWTAIMQLVETNKLALHDDISEFLGFTFRNPYFPDRLITPYHLLTHASSLSCRKMTSAPDSMADFFCQNRTMSLAQWVKDYLSPDGKHYRAEQVFDRYPPGDFTQLTPDPIGVIAGYSNLNAMLAAYLVEQVMQQPFETYAQQAIFSPLGLTDIGWHKTALDQSKLITPYEAKNSPRAAFMGVFTKSMQDKGYLSQSPIALNNSNKTYLPFDHCSLDTPFNAAGLLGSSAAALTTFMQAFLPQSHSTSPLLQRKTIDQCWQVKRSDAVTGSVLGMGWFQFATARHGTFWGHDGGGPGILSRVMIDPTTGNGVVLLINNFFVDFRQRARLLDELCAALEQF
ncbi:serine hydrolase domain-containing protein [Photobacterium aphoticum]|uniref:Beta-lactamase-related domain-containing protein n=1 Tax=Photobacterium aphoticum TaxID=754436 RepID=A0A0J1GL95_9GAMM|nr:serine hydrolase [Photobacterium aphoticum]KLV00391.1 hypothetical protein ABT58_12000 [Photobacterium aphoticum]GHA42840.1 hypothetical protein GCM10007086_15590 [Photobacterium aphoticum]